MLKKLVLFTAEFPYGKGETFLETEILYLSEGFEEVVLVVTERVTSTEMRKIPENCKVVKLDLTPSKKDKLSALSNRFSPIYKAEKDIILNQYRIEITKGIRNTMLLSLHRAKKVKDYILNAHQDELTTTCFYSYWCNDVALGLAMARRSNMGIKAISRIHGWDVYFEASAFGYLPFRHFITENLTTIYAISEAGKQYVGSTWQQDMSRVHVSRLGVKMQRTGAATGVFKLVSCSNVIPLKRVELIVEALSKIKDVTIEWTHFGDGKELKKVFDLAQKVANNITIKFKGRVPNTEVLAWYSHNHPHLFINVSTSEGVPVSIMEAMSFGIPVFATDVGGNSEIVNTENGVLLNVDISSKELAEQIVSYTRKTEAERLSYSQNAYSTWNDFYNAESNYREFVELIRLVV